MMPRDTPEITAVKTFFDLISRDRFDEAVDMLAADVLYHNIPLPEMTGRENVRAFHKGFGIGTSIRADWKITRIAQAGNAVLTERMDLFTQADGRRIVLPTMGSMVLDGNVITEWRDYFDLASFERQAAAMKA
ncbi:limonene-1,2-epoxide hydrolase family protein [Pararoseomonas indoligenes]|uniref:Nuclear transport factor 2 family protein n=1 Tax=Roseomonas indoligenes TaxID=2820811 RepID=A0A940N359_9PROT|nr:limonene-1,2-epoxide hydrolase family protein [Pararoseomonas indoligenes]MBP0495166.1 nuclear transport factor 2 family protein [Pararoseomonas indoligenes]